MLETHELDVDTAESAEDALEYLNDHRPDVIFMDHLMPGMDGFEAVSAIKNNPDTATIPIMMYTSQEGELYVGQARALGAVGVLPKQVEPVEVSKILESLRVIGKGPDKRVHPDGSEASDVSGDYPSLEKIDQDIRVLIRDLFDQQRSVLRRDLLDSYESIASRVADEIRAAEPTREEVGNDEDDADKATNFVSGRTQIAVALLAVVALVFAWLYWQREQSWFAMQQQNAELQRVLDEQLAFGSEGAIQAQQRFSDYQRSLGNVYDAALRSLQWAANQSTDYAYDEMPLGDRRLAIVEELTGHLSAIGFTGVVRIETHVGDFCLSANGPDGFSLAFPDLPASQCDRIGYEAVEAFELGLRQSVGFANFLRIAESRTGGDIVFEIVSQGNTMPILDYPLDVNGVSASFWNEIAAGNNRVEITILNNPE